MRTPKYKHLSFEDRCIIQEFLNYGHAFTEIGNRIGKDRTAISKEIRHHRFTKIRAASSSVDCPKTSKPPYVCNPCSSKPHCRKIQFIYDASVAHNEYLTVLSKQRSNLRITKEQIASINEIISPLMIHKHHSVNHVYASHPELLPFSKSTFYRYVDLGILNVRNIDLARKVRYRIKKEYRPTYCAKNTAIKIDRFYKDFQTYMEYHPLSSIVEMDTVIGTSGGKGGKCFLTLLFRNFNFMLIYLLPYRKVEYVTATFEEIRAVLGEDEFSRLFEVILTDNGSEFSDPVSIEHSLKTGDRLSKVFYCDPNSSWQKGSIEKNHEYIRYILPKGTSFAGLSQSDCNLIASHINSVPRLSLNNQSPYEASIGFIGKDNMDKLGIQKIPSDDIDLTIRLLKR